MFFWRYYENEKRNYYIDFLRGISILLVVFSHYGAFLLAPATFFFSTARNGYFGVSIFFAISGFLITSNVLQKTHQQLQNIAIGKFYLFRASRIFPALILLCIINFSLFKLHFPGFQISPVDAAQENYKTLLNYIFTFRFNLFYLNGGALLFAWSVLWSLAIEEVFYLVFPLISVILRTRYHVALFMLFLVFYGPYYRNEYQWSACYLYFGCFDQLALGCLAAIVAQSQWHYLFRRFSSLLCALGLLIIFLTYYAGDIHHTFIYAPTLIAFGASLFLIGASKINTASFKYQFLFPICLLGILSYEIYLFHVVIYLLLKPLFANFFILHKSKWIKAGIFLLVLGLITTVCGALYFYLLEPIREKIRRFILLPLPSFFQRAQE